MAPRTKTRWSTNTYSNVVKTNGRQKEDGEQKQDGEHQTITNKTKDSGQLQKVGQYKLVKEKCTFAY